MSPLEIDHHFFASLITANLPELERMLAPDFILIDVMSGSEIPKAAFLGLVGAGRIAFESITPADNRVRVYHTSAIITGRTEMRGKLGDTAFVAHSRYTHVYDREQNEWRLVSAQGTQIKPLQES